MDLYTANAAHALHAQEVRRVMRELEHRRAGKERAQLQDVTELGTSADVSTPLTVLVAVSLPQDAVAVSGKSDRKAARRGVPTVCRP